MQSSSRNRSLALPLLIACLAVLGPASAWSQVACKPLLSIKSVRDVRVSSQPTLPWQWHATITADSRHCATASGNFEVDFVRIKENAPDQQFTEKFRWRQDQFDVSMELTTDEAILGYRIGFIAPCVCRDVSQLVIDPVD